MVQWSNTYVLLFVCPLAVDGDDQGACNTLYRTLLIRATTAPGLNYSFRHGSYQSNPAKRFRLASCICTGLYAQLLPCPALPCPLLLLPKILTVSDYL